MAETLAGPGELQHGGLSFIVAHREIQTIFAGAGVRPGTQIRFIQWLRYVGSRQPKLDLLIFDLDGTLIDSKLDLAHAVNATRAYLGMPTMEHDTIYSYVGNGAPVLIRRALGEGASEADVAAGLEFFLRYYRDHMLDYTVLYPGVRETLQELHAEGKQLAVLTNKPVRMSVAILEGLGVGSQFFQIFGGNSFEQKKPHPVGVEALLAESGAAPEKTLMVGDSGVDIQTARNAGIRACGVTYGFQPETLTTYPPDFLIDRFEQLAAVVRGS